MLTFHLLEYIMHLQNHRLFNIDSVRFVYILSFIKYFYFRLVLIKRRVNSKLRGKVKSRNSEGRKFI